jgi:BlaI family penicillinase repressor
MLKLSRRERQILDILYERGRATASEIQAALPDAPGYSATRALLRILEEKRHVKHEADGPRYVFSPRIPRERARRSALKHLVRTFFEGSAGDAVAALLDTSAAKLTPEDLDRLEALIERARKEGK